LALAHAVEFNFFVIFVCNQAAQEAQTQLGQMWAQQLERRFVLSGTLCDGTPDGDVPV
jgi:hypothetical protein